MADRSLTTGSDSAAPLLDQPAVAVPRGASIGGTIRLLRLLLVASVIVPAVVFVGASSYAWRDIRIEATEQASRTAQILREHALKVFEAHEFALDQIEDRIAELDWDTIRTSQAVNRSLIHIADRHDQVISAYVLDRDGLLANTSTRFPAPPLRALDRSYFTAVRDGYAGAYIGEPTIGRLTGRQIIQVSRRLVRGGEFDGVLVVSVLLERFTSFYRGITSIQENSVTLGRTDGTVLSREPPITTGASKLTPASGFMRAIRTGGKTYRTVGELDGIERIHAIERVGGFPVYVSYGLAMTGLYHTWLMDVLLYALFAVGASVGLVLVSWLALRQARSEQGLIVQWQDEVHRREAAERTLRQTQKMEALGQLTGGVAHDFNNLLMVISGNVELLKTKAAGVADRQIAAIEHAARNGEALTRKLLAFSRRGLVQAKPIDIGSFLVKVVDLIKPSLPPGVEIETAIPQDVWPVRADEDDLELSLVNVVLNARDAIPDGGRVTIAARNRSLRADPLTENLDGDFVELSIADNGIGIAPENLSRVFEPFFTTKEVGRGTGLGLSQVYGFAKQSGGAVAIGSVQGRGTTVTLYLPRSPAPAIQRAERAAKCANAAKQVLLVEDNKEVAEATAAMLESLGCTVRHAAAAEPALQLLDAGETFDLVLSDIVMPGGLDGLQLARALRKRFPALPVLLTTGYSNAAEKAAGDKIPILLKPYQIEALQQAIGDAVAARRAG